MLLIIIECSIHYILNHFMVNFNSIMCRSNDVEKSKCLLNMKVKSPIGSKLINTFGKCSCTFPSAEFL